MSQLTRHGSRGPIFNYLPINWDTERNISSMDLLDLGWRQHYLGGLNMRKKYPEFFSELKAEQYEILSGEFTRTVESVLARMHGINDTFELLNENQQEKTEKLKKVQSEPFNYNQFVVRASPSDYDPMIIFGNFKECKDYLEEKQKNTQSIKKQLMGQSPKILQFAEDLRVKLGWEDVPTWDEMAMMGDEAIADSNYGGEKQFFTDDNFYQKLMLINYGNHLVKYYDKEFIKIYSSPILRDIAKDILSKYRSHLNLTSIDYPLKFKLYSGHDTTFSPILLNLGLIDRDCVLLQTQYLTDLNCKVVSKIKEGSSLTWELIEIGPSEHYVRTNFNGKYINFCNLKPKQMRPVDQNSSMPKFDCSLQQFDLRIRDITEPNWYRQCYDFRKKQDKDVEYQKQLYRLAFAAVGFFCVMSMAYAIQMKKELRILDMWKRHVIDNEWSEHDGEELNEIKSQEQSVNGSKEPRKEKNE